MNTTFHFYFSKLSAERHGITVLLSKQTPVMATVHSFGSENSTGS